MHFYSSFLFHYELYAICGIILKNLILNNKILRNIYKTIKLKGAYYMKELLIMSFLALSIGILLLILAIKLLIKKKGGPAIVYSSLILFPIFLLLVPSVLVSPLASPNSSPNYLFGNLMLSVPRGIYCFNILIFVVFVLIKENISPVSILDNKENVKSNLKNIAAGIRLLHYSILVNILYIIPTFIGIVHIMHSTTLTDSSFFLGLFTWAVILFLPLAQIYVIAVFAIISLIILGIIIFITSINGIIRITSTTVQNKKSGVFYFIVILLPIINVIYMFFVCHLGNKELKNAGVMS